MYTIIAIYTCSFIKYDMGTAMLAVYLQIEQLDDEPSQFWINL